MAPLSRREQIKLTLIEKAKTLIAKKHDIPLIYSDTKRHYKVSWDASDTNPVIVTEYHAREISHGKMVAFLKKSSDYLP